MLYADENPESLCHCGTIRDAIKIAADDLVKSHAHDRCVVWMLQVAMAYTLIAHSYGRLVMQDGPYKQAIEEDGIAADEAILMVGFRVREEMKPMIKDIMKRLEDAPNA